MPKSDISDVTFILLCDIIESIFEEHAKFVILEEELKRTVEAKGDI